MKRVFEVARIGLSGVVTNPLRSVLAMLGMVVGVAAVVVLISLGKGVQEQVTGEIEGLGTDLVRINPGASPEGAGGLFGVSAASTLTPEDARRVEGLPSVAAASSNVALTATVGGGAAGSAVESGQAFSGVDPGYAGIRSLDLAAGRFVENPGEVVVAQATATKFLGREVSGSGFKEALGESLSVNGERYVVVGVTAGGSSRMGFPQPETSYVTTGDALRLSGTGTVGRIVAKVKDSGDTRAAVGEIRTELGQAHGAGEFSVVTQERLLSTFTRVTDLLTYLLAGIASISLLVGGIGIMNVMLTSVAERTREIGARKAIGASDGDILLQFLCEAVFIASLGGLSGIGLGVGVSALLPRISENLPTATTWDVVLLVYCISAGVGVLFGVLPAYRSSRLQPVEALRRE